MSNSVRPHRQQPTRLPRPWDSPGKNTGVGCLFLLQCTKVKSESEVAQSCPTLCDPMDCRLLGSSIHGIFQARVLEWGAIAFSSIYIYTLIHKKFSYIFRTYYFLDTVLSTLCMLFIHIMMLPSVVISGGNLRRNFYSFNLKKNSQYINILPRNQGR